MQKAAANSFDQSRKQLQRSGEALQWTAVNGRGLRQELLTERHSGSAPSSSQFGRRKCILGRLMSMRNFPVVSFVMAAGVALCQDTDRPTFEVISVKPSAMQGGQYGIGLATFPGGRIRANMVALDYFISE